MRNILTLYPFFSLLNPFASAEGGGSSVSSGVSDLAQGKQTNKQTTCKRRVRLPQIFTSSRSKAALDDLLGDSHHEDPRHPLYEDVPHPGRHPVSARLPAREKCQRWEDGD